MRTVPVDGLMAAKLSAIPSARIVRALTMVPIAKRPTAMDSTIKIVRALLPHKSLSILCQRELIINELL